jgi:glycosyltransferase involved in cell wall biosynthesis
MRIAHFCIGRCNPESANGVDKAVYYLSRTQATLGHDVAVFSLTAKPALPIPGVNVRTYAPKHAAAAPVHSRLRELLITRSPLNLPRRLVEELLAWQPDMLHLHFVHLPQNIALAMQAERRGIPYCVTIHGGLSRSALSRRRLQKRLFGALIEHRYLKRAAFLHAISAEDLDGLRAYGAPTNRVVVAPNGMDPEDLLKPRDPRELRDELPALGDRQLLLFIGRLDPEQKGLDLAIRAFAAARHQNVMLVLAGPDWRGGRARLEAMARDLGVGEQVLFTGPVFGQQKADLLHAASAFVHLSRWEAGIPFSVLEAAAVGRPCLLTTAADPARQLERAGGAIVVEVDEQEIAAGMRRLFSLTEPELVSMGAAAHDLVAREFSWTPIVERLVQEYEQHAVHPSTVL